MIDDKSVSRRHAALERRGSGFAVVDQGSANGSFVNGEQVSEASLYDGQELRLGMVPFRVEDRVRGRGHHPHERGRRRPATMLMPSSAPSPAPPAYAPALRRPTHRPRPSLARLRAAARTRRPHRPTPPRPRTPPPATPRDEAAGALACPAHASHAEVKARLTEMSADLESRVAQARTPNLLGDVPEEPDDLETRRGAAGAGA